jgi:prepilin-type N-terminal cleavage/methylation domain-containing protein
MTMTAQAHPQKSPLDVSPRRRAMGQRGETLIEVLIAIVLLGAISSAYFIGATTQTRASASNRELVQADAVARSYAELAKSAVRTGCTPGAAFTVDTSSFPAGYTPSTPTSGPHQQLCPQSPTSPQIIDLTITTPHNYSENLSFEVLTP